MLFFVAFLILYTLSATDKVPDFFHICTALKKLSKFLLAYEFGQGYEKEKERLLEYYPIIKKYDQTCQLQYGTSDFSLKWNAEQIYNNLRMVKNEKRIELKYALNPFSVIRKTFYLPSSFLKSKKPQASVISLLLHLLLWAVEIAAEHILGTVVDAHLIPYIQSACQSILK